MSPAVLHPPALSTWLQQLAGIIPLTALIEFVDPPTVLHTFELSGSVPLWNWPVTPAGARLLFAPEDSHGDWYPCSTPTTSRLCVSSRGAVTTVPNKSPNMEGERGRRQKLEV